MAITLKVTVAPADTVWLAGCEVITGAPGAGPTVSSAVALVVLPPELTATTK